ncbi:TAP42-like protein [Conidiobolus coronatus NRRL 28638]|uniref:TAP42-like protein n=1 Tax=Conidiobolus coronatus (strain ATCC 28846 / CBS 209.66 / NRRL 28638) TaxID=796925 RepID=A0A137NVF2_CONC2|nr:TAP42-like protein [Conidiobolus coronatus NRRL 28638]|eukprot:KXN66621.1 TAP42-like protein [Conidiobolus coronatus NRRL 28638]
MSEKSDNISTIFDKCEAEYNELDNSSLRPNDSEYKNLVNGLLEKFIKLDQLANNLSLFSDNEFFEELSTPSIKLLVLQYYLAHLKLKLNDNKRKQNLEDSKKLFLAFLNLVDNYDLLDKEDKARKEAFESGDNVGPIKLENRDTKIARFKREKSLEQDIKELQSKLDNSIELEADDDKDDVLRDLLTSKTKLFISKSFNEITSIAQELDVLSMMPPPSSSDSQKTSNEDNEWRLDNLSKLNQNGALMDKSGKPLRPFVITGKQQELRDQVFRQSWRLPTMTIDDYLQKQMEMGNVLQGGGERPTKAEVDDNDYDALDKETYKKREEDEFKDNNPRGWGNRGNKG